MTNARVPLSNLDIERQVAFNLGEAKRARHLGSDIRATWFTDRMDGGLDLLLERSYGA